MTDLVVDNKAALEFLEWLRQGGPWVLTAIPPGDGPIITETFAGDEARRNAFNWIAAHNGKQNLYFMVNPARGLLRSKAKKEDVEAMAFLHVDVDPAKGEAMTLARPRIKAALEAFVPAPSAIIDSGGGYQGFWRLSEDLYIGGDLGRAADAEAYNQQLETLLGGDHCFNCDRIMRLPGTVNLPNPKKQKLGRVPAVSAVVSLTETAYNLSEFTAAPKVQDRSGGVSSATRVKLTGNLPPVLIDDLPETVTLKIRMLIVQGEDPDDQTKYASRSHVAWAVTCGLVRAGCDDDTIASILLDKDYAVSAHVLHQKRPVDYVARQIQRAREECEEPFLRVLNEKHAVIADMGGKCRVISEVLDVTLKRPRLRISKQSFEDFRNRYMHQKVQVGQTAQGAAVYMSAGKWWLQHEMRRQYTSLVFAPRREVEDAYNLWQGFACEAIPGDQHQPLLDHLLNNLCSGNVDYYNYIMRWMARTVQEPDQAGEVAIVLRGGMGTGKGTLINAFGSLWGRHFLQISSAKHLVGQFNSHLRDCVVLFADEAFFAGDKANEGVLRGLITEELIFVEGKGLDGEVAPNFTHIFMASNSDWVIPAGADERRFLVINVGEGNKQDLAYFTAIRKAMDSGGREAFLHQLMNMDLTDFNVRAIPQTEALREQKLFSLNLEQQWWLERLMDGRTTAYEAEWQETLPKTKLVNDYLRYADAQKTNHRLSPTSLGKFLARMMPGDFPVSEQRTADVMKTDEHGQSEVVRERVYFYDLPTLEDCRAEWDKRFGDATAWPKEESEAQATNRDNPGIPPPY